MEVLEAAENDDIKELIIERDENVPSLISVLYHADNTKLLEHLQLCMRYLRTYTVSQAVEELLQHVVLAIKQSLQKLYEDNILLSATVEDDIVIDILKEKLQIAVSFLNTIKMILNFLTENKEIHLNTLNDVPVNLLEVILCTFEHCKDSADEYKTVLNTELLEIFYVTQEAHLLFLKLFESCIVIPTNTSAEINELNKVSEIICKMSDILSEISIKSMSDNWKGYVAIVQKFSPLLDNTLDLKIPVQSLTFLIRKNLNSISTEESVDSKPFMQVVKIASFLLKVSLKVFDIFWNHLEKITLEVLVLCCTIYSYSSDIKCTNGCSSENILLLESSVINPLEPFLLRLAVDHVLVKIIHSGTRTLPAEYNFGFIIFLNNILHCLVVCEHRPEKFDVASITSTIFKGIKQCYTDFVLDKYSAVNIFDELVLNITATILLYGGYPKIELILFENILQEHIWNALLAVEVWTLFLHNSNSQMCLATLVSLIKKLQEIDFGMYTNRLEKVYLRCLMQRIFSMLPPHMKNDIVTKCCPRRNTDIWKMIGFQNFSFQQKFAIEDVCADVINGIDSIQENSSLNDFIFVMENLDVLSTTNFNHIGVNCTQLMKCLCNFWEFNFSSKLIDNNAFKYFIRSLCKITSIFMSEINTKALIMILSQLKALSVHDCYKLSVCEALSLLSQRKSQYNQDESKINTLVADIIYPNMLCTKRLVIKQSVLELIDNLANNGKHDIVENIISNELNGEVSNYLQKIVTSSRLDKEYLINLDGLEFQHECIKWKDDIQCHPKRRKLAEPTFKESCKNAKEKQVNERVNIMTASELETKNLQMSHDGGNVGEVISDIKGEVKCLLNVLKTEKLSAKNASDLKLIANQILSLM